MVDSSFLPHFLLGPQDIVVLGQDGMVANTLKYLNGHLLIGRNSDPLRWNDMLLPFRVEDVGAIVQSRPITDLRQ